MKYAIVTSSKTGNTEQLAQRLKSCLPAEDCIFCGTPAAGVANGADFVFVGFWTDKGGCDEAMALFLRELHEKRLFLFGTAGFGGAADYFEQILARVAQNVEASNTVEGTYMCQGKMPASVKQRYEAMLESGSDKAKAMLENFEKALSHPNAVDLDGLERAIATYVR